MKTFGFIGTGNLAQAVVSGLIKNKAVRSSQVIVTDRSLKKARTFAKSQKAKVATSNLDLVNRSDFVFLATKPQDALPVLKEIGPQMAGKVLVSLAAGIDCATLARHLYQNRGLVRVMANTPAQIQKGVYGIYFKKGDSSSRTLLTKMFSKIGIVVPLKNDREVDMITAGSASGIGFVFELMAVFETWFRKSLPAKLSRQIAVEVFLGAAELAREQSAVSLVELRNRVTSKKGTTLAGLKAMKKAGLQNVVKKGLDAGKMRARQISQTLGKAK